MTGKQRVISAINHKSEDRVPITFDADGEVYERLYSYFNIFDKDRKKRLFERMNIDTWMLLPGNFNYTPEEAAKEGVRRSIWGVDYIRVNLPNGACHNEICGTPLNGKDDISDLKNYPFPKASALDFSSFGDAAQTYKEQAVIGVASWGVYHTASFMRGMENIMLDFAMRPEYLHYLFDRIAEYMLEAAAIMLEKHSNGIDIVYIADDYCSQRGPLFSPDDFREYCFPYLKQMGELIHKHNKKFQLHVCGSVRQYIPQLIEAGVDMLEPIQTRAAGMNPVELKREFGKELCFYGGMDLQDILVKGTPLQVADEAKYLIETLWHDGGYVFGPGHTYIQADAPLENIIAMYETAANIR